ncbi:MAG TPA: VWA domain-containing protein, partial [Flavisolibacter sp.]|nr:VWA domain-containing protein [Flavisolibacter sp.]
KARKKIGDVHLVKELSKNHSRTKTIIKFSLVAIAFACGCIALANPRIPDKNSGEVRKGIDVVIALDVSNSMKATDIAPDRLSRAKQFISRIIDNLKDDRIGLVVFAGYGYAQMPLTFDYDAARLYVASADPANISAQGTSIADAFDKANLLFGKESERFKSIILITDGETHDENAMEKLKELADKGVMVNTVGIGSPEGSTIKDSSGNIKTDASGQPVVSRLNEQILQQIAQATNGIYVHLQSSDAAVKQVMNQYTKIEKKALGDTSLYTYESYYTWLALPMLLLLIAETFLPDRKKVKS